MPVSVCRYEKNTACVLLKASCIPGRKGCVIVKAGYKVTVKEKDTSRPKKQRVTKQGA